MREQVAKDLAESGLFDWVGMCWFSEKPYSNQGMVGNLGEGAYLKPNGRSSYVAGKSGDEQYERGMIGYCGPWPDADTSEAILAEMELQVVYVGNDFFIVDDRDYQAEIEETNFFGWPYGYVLQNTKRGQRTLANNAALAQLSKQPEWIDKLKTAIETVKGKERR
jgi:hypothetical protein